MSTANSSELSSSWLTRWLRLHSPSAPQPERPLLLGVSGGLDSMTLWHLLHQSGLPYAVSHIAYGLRGADSAAEVALIEQTCEVRQVQLHLARPAFSPGTKLQERARRVRQEIWSELMLSHAALVLAHHANDQVETVLMRLSRGTGPQGLAGMREVSAGVLRPLLGFAREALTAFAKTHHVAYLEDASNATDCYTRNKFRHQVLPPLTHVEPRTLTAVCTTAQQQQELLDFAAAQVEQVLAQALLPLPANLTAHQLLTGPFDRPQLACISGLSALLDFWLGADTFGSQTISDIVQALKDGQPHRRHFFSKCRTRCCVIAGQRVWLEQRQMAV